MLKLDGFASYEEIPRQLWPKSCVRPEELRGVEPVPAEVSFTVFPSFQDWGIDWDGLMAEKTTGHLISSAWFEGCRNIHDLPPVVEGETAVPAEGAERVRAFYVANSNNGCDVDYVFTSQDRHKSLYKYLSLAVSPCHGTWQPDRVAFIKIDKWWEATLNRVVELLDIDRLNMGKSMLGHFPTVNEFLRFAEKVDGNFGTSKYLRVAKFLEVIGYAPLVALLRAEGEK